MNCVELKTDIDRLKQELSTLETEFERMNEAGRPSRKFRKMMQSELSDEILEKYLDDFGIQNPGIVSSPLKLGNWIDIRDSKGNSLYNTMSLWIIAIAQTSDGHMLVGGDTNILYSGLYDDQGKLVLNDQIYIGDAGGSPAEAISTIMQTGDGHILVGGFYDTLYSASYNDQGKLVLDGKINIGNTEEHISTITQTSDGHILIGGTNGILYSASYNDQGKLVLDGKINIGNTEEHISAITQTSDGHILIGGTNGILYSASYNDQGKLVLGDQIHIKGLSWIHAITQTSDGHVFIGGDDNTYGYNGPLYSASYNDQGKLVLDDLAYTKDDNRFITQISDGHILIGGTNGILYSASYNDQGKLVLGDQIHIKGLRWINAITQTNNEHMLIGAGDGIYFTSLKYSVGELKKRLPDIIRKGGVQS